MTTQVPPLIEIQTEIPDPRQPKGKRYPLDAMLTLACVAMLCGYRSIKAIAEWGPNYGEKYLESLGFNEHGYPAQATWYRVLRAVYGFCCKKSSQKQIGKKRLKGRFQLTRLNQTGH